MNVESYLRRIHYSGSVEPDADTLRQLHLAHLLTVPFENLDIHLGRSIVLEDAALFDKIVERRRGGFCYELNGLFCWLLRELGFNVRKLSAGVARAEGGFDPYFDHMALLVELEQLWLADVGFGDSFRQPIPLSEKAETYDGFGLYSIRLNGDVLVLTRRLGLDQAEPQYRFTVQPYEYADFAEMCVHHQTSPDSPFTRARVCTLATKDGRLTLKDMRLITTNGRAKHERLVSDEDERNGILRDLFGIEI